MTSVDHLLAEAKLLSEDQRLTLAHRLLALDENQADGDTEGAWDLEIRERIASFDRGEARSRPAGDVISDLDRRLGS